MALVELIILMAGVQKYRVMSSGLSPELLHSAVCQHVVVHSFQLIIQRNGGTFPVLTKTHQHNRRQQDKLNQNRTCLSKLTDGGITVVSLTTSMAPSR